MIKKRICPIHGIWNKEHNDDRCPKCRKTTAKVYDNNSRNKESNKIYQSKQWKNIRTKQLTNNPFCIRCGRVANLVDHIIEIKDGGAAYDINNLQSMCTSCHNTKTFEAKKIREGL